MKLNTQRELWMAAVYPKQMQEGKAPTWPAIAHNKLDTAVLTVNGWSADLDEEGILAHLLAENLRRAGANTPPKGTRHAN